MRYTLSTTALPIPSEARAVAFSAIPPRSHDSGIWSHAGPYCKVVKSSAPIIFRGSCGGFSAVPPRSHDSGIQSHAGPYCKVVQSRALSALPFPPGWRSFLLVISLASPLLPFQLPSPSTLSSTVLAGPGVARRLLPPPGLLCAAWKIPATTPNRQQGDPSTAVGAKARNGGGGASSSPPIDPLAPPTPLGLRTAET